MKRYNLKWQNDLGVYIDTFNSFVIEGNINDLQPVCMGESHKYVSLSEAISEQFFKDYCVVSFDHTRVSGKTDAPARRSSRDEPAPEEEEPQQKTVDPRKFGTFTIFGAQGPSSDPNLLLFDEYYQPEYMDRISSTLSKTMQGNIKTDIRRIFDCMSEFGERVKDERFTEAKPFLFILPNVSRYMTVAGDPDEQESAVLMTLFNATQLFDTPCKLVMMVDKINDLPTWFESEKYNPALKKLFLPTPDAPFREVFYENEMTPIMRPIPPDQVLKIRKFASFTDNYTLKRLMQLRSFIANRVGQSGYENVDSIDHIDKTVSMFEVGQTDDRWKSHEMKLAISELRSICGDAPEGIGKGTLFGVLPAVKAVESALRAAVVDVTAYKGDNRRPRAVFFFSGPTGTGKTQVTKEVAKKIFDTEDRIIRFDMSEFGEEHTDSRLFGAPPGYVGYEEGGELTRAIKQEPCSIVLFDEIEKAHRRIWDKFLQILGEGRLTDGRGETVSFAQSVIVFTSNLGMTPTVTTSDTLALNNVVEEIEQEMQAVVERFNSDGDSKKAYAELLKLEKLKASYCGIKIGMGDDPLFQKFYLEARCIDAGQAFEAFVNTHVKETVAKYFDDMGRREIYGRIGVDNIVVFNFLSKKNARDKVLNDLRKFCDYYRDIHPQHIDLDASGVEDFFIKRCSEPSVLDLGGRGIETCMNDLFKDSMGKFLFENEGTNISARFVVSNDVLSVERV